MHILFSLKMQKNVYIFIFLEETPKHDVLGDPNATIVEAGPKNNVSKEIIINGNAAAATAASQAPNDTNSDRIKYVYVREHEHMHHGHSHAHSHIHSAPDSISSVAYMVSVLFILL